jgi:tetratricopeptide (TPR) repeat protein
MAEILVVVWLSGIAIISGRAIRQWLRFLATIRASRIPADRRLKECVNVVKRQLKFRRAVRLVVINHNYGPLVFGYLHPVLVLPWSLVQQSSTRELQPVIAHELIHVRRGDTLLCLLQFLARTIWWFNPLVGWASRATDELAERCCDLDVVNGLPCKATDYVRSLLRIIEMCQAPIGVAGTVGLRPADITIRRLRWLALQRPGRSPARGWSSWLVASAAALLVYPAAGSPPQQEHPKIRDAQQAVSSRDQEANQAFDSQNWESAARLYQSIVVENPDNGLAWFRLGYSLQAVGKLDEAIFAHEKASAFPRGRKTALYNWACALSRKGEYEAALDKLGEALDAGFLRPAALDEDADFAPLLENERFKQLVKRHQELVIIADAADSGRHAGIMSTEGPRSGSSIRVVDASALEQMAFWSGNWKITDVDGNQLGSAVVTLDEKEHWYVEQWSGSDGSTGTGKLLYDPASQLWIENFEGSGKKFNLAGSLTGKTLELSGDITIDGQRRMSGRLNLVRLEDGRLHLTMTSSADDGQTWTPVSEVFYAKIDP